MISSFEKGFRFFSSPVHAAKKRLNQFSLHTLDSCHAAVAAIERVFRKVEILFCGSLFKSRITLGFRPLFSVGRKQLEKTEGLISSWEEEEEEEDGRVKIGQRQQLPARYFERPEKSTVDSSFPPDSSCSRCSVETTDMKSRFK